MITEMRVSRQRIAAWLLLALLLVPGRAALAQEARPEAEVKAAFLFNFTKFIEWPAEAFENEKSPLSVGVFGDEKFTQTLKVLLADKMAHGRSFTVKRLTNVQEAKSYQILFFREAETRKMGAVYETIKRAPILTVGESEDFLEQGGMFNFFFEDKQLRFEVNRSRVENAKLGVSSKLLRLAKDAEKGGVK